MSEIKFMKNIARQKKAQQKIDRLNALRKFATHCEFCGEELAIRGGWCKTGLCKNCAAKYYE